MIRKNVSISNTHLKLLDPLLKKHEGNMSAAIRDVIDFVGFVNENVGCLDSAKELLTKKNHVKEITTNRVHGITIPLTMFRWFLNSRNSLFPPSDEVLQLFQSHKTNIYDINRIDKIINEELSYLNWPVSVTVGNDDGNISFQISGTDSEINLFSAILISSYYASYSRPLKIVENLICPASVYMQFSEASSREEAFEIAERYFSGIKVNTDTYPDNCMSQEPAENMEYWKNIFRYIDVTTACHIHTRYQEDNELF